MAEPRLHIMEQRCQILVTIALYLCLTPAPRYFRESSMIGWTIIWTIQSTREVHRTVHSANLQESTTPCSIHSVLGLFTPHQLSLSRLRKIMPEEHHVYSGLKAQTSPGIQTYSEAPFPARQTPRELQIAA